MERQLANVTEFVYSMYILGLLCTLLMLYPYLWNFIITLCVNNVYVLNHINFLHCLMHETDLNY
jgi:hypothetical protein